MFATFLFALRDAGVPASITEYLSLLAGYRVLLIIVAGCYLGAIIADRR